MPGAGGRAPVAGLNECITCRLCGGYYADATTIVECLHTFCRSCIVRYLERNKYCPVCEVQVHKTKPLLNIRPDKTLQDVVYKLVPKLYHNEMQRRRDFYLSHPEAAPLPHELQSEATYQHILAPDENVCLSLGYKGTDETPRRYLSCPAGVTVGHLKKLLRAKYDLPACHQIEVMFNKDTLADRLSMMDVAYIYSWKRKGPINLTYSIVEGAAKKPKLDQAAEPSAACASDDKPWKEVQLRISENGEMSITGIHDAGALLDVVVDNQAVVEAKPKAETKKEMPGLKLIGKKAAGEQTTQAQAVKKEETVKSRESCEKDSAGSEKSDDKKVSEKVESEVQAVEGDKEKVDEKVKEETKTKAVKETSEPQPQTNTTLLPVVVTTVSSKPPPPPPPVVTLTTIPPASTTTVFSTTSTKCSVKINDDAVKKDNNVVAAPTNNNLVDKNLKRKSESIIENENSAKHPKPTILNHSIGLLNLSNNHPLKKHSKLNRNGDNVSKSTIIVHKNVSIPPPKALNKFPSTTTPCYMPKATYGAPATTTVSRPSTPARTRASTAQAPPPAVYKTLREPPKTWNSQISRAQQQQAAAKGANNGAGAGGAAEPKGVRPAKFFKGRNNMPRYLGNPASGVKPMYQVHVSPEKEKPPDPGAPPKIEKSEIRKHSIVKIDPKTLKPISEKAPETTSLSNVTSTLVSLGAPPATMGDLKINTSSVSIFNPLKLQSSSPKGERRSPNSPHSPKVKSAPSSVAPSPSSSSSPTRRHQPALTFTPPNPFVPDLSSPTLGPGAPPFLYPAGAGGPPGFPPPYDPRVMAAYRSLWYDDPRAARFPPFKSTLDAVAELRAAYGRAVAEAKLQKTQKAGGTRQESGASPKHPLPSSSQSSPQQTSSSPLKKPKDPPKPEKSLENAVEKLTQNKVKELGLLAIGKSDGKDKKVIEQSPSDKNKEPAVDAKKNPQDASKTRVENTESKENSKNHENTSSGKTNDQKSSKDAKSSADTSKSTDTSKNGTDTSKSGADISKVSTDDGKNCAETSKSNPETKGGPDTSKSSRDAFKNSTDTSKNCTDTGKTSAEISKTSADTGKSEAEVKKGAETNKSVGACEKSGDSDGKTTAGVKG